MLPGIDKGWSFAFMVNRERTATGRSAGSLSWAGLNNTFFFIDRQQDVAAVMITQLLPFCDPGPLALFDAVETVIHQQIGN
jgi:hypothetical protein